MRLGTRGSPLALTQARMVRQALAAAHGFQPEQIEIVMIRTSGDRIQDRPLAEAGGKGLFTKEIEEALLAGAIDLAVHSSKDMPTVLPRGLVLSAFLEREDPRDVFISRKAKSIAELPRGATVGTASLRRQAMVKRLRPDLVVVPLRGNVETRLRKLDDGVADATLLGARRAEAARAGRRRRRRCSTSMNFCRRSGRAPSASRRAPTTPERATCWRAINHADTATALAAERAFLAVLDGSCRTPIAGHATIAGGSIRFRGMIVKPDGSEAFETTREGERRDAERLGADAGAELKRRAGPDFFAVPDHAPSRHPARARQRAHRRGAARAWATTSLLAPLLRIETVAGADLGPGAWAAVLLTSANGARALAAPSAACANCCRCRCLRSAGAAPMRRAPRASPTSPRPMATPTIWRALPPRAFRDRTCRCFISPARTAPATLPARSRRKASPCAPSSSIAPPARPNFRRGALARWTHGGSTACCISPAAASRAYWLAAATSSREALAPVHYCLSARAAEPLRLAGAATIHVAARPDEAQPARSDHVSAASPACEGRHRASAMDAPRWDERWPRAIHARNHAFVPARSGMTQGCSNRLADIAPHRSLGRLLSHPGRVRIV